MRKNIVAGNWKMHKTLQEGLEFARDLNERLKKQTNNCSVILATPHIHLASIAQSVDSDLIKVAAQNCSDKDHGAYTGETSAKMIKSTGASYVLIGHSERRQYHCETNELLNKKIKKALENGLSPIFCFGEKLEERENNEHFNVVKKQLSEVLFNLNVEDFSKIVLAYEPVWAIGTGKTASVEQVEEMHAFIRNTLTNQFDADFSDEVTILYGGSCKPSNAGELFANKDVDGGLIGGASLNVDDFLAIINAF